MADLRCTIAGITSPNPFWLASAPPTDKAYNVNRAFEAAWHKGHSHAYNTMFYI
jgi:dihydropyrimidine dehydrogenase (NAD+) subunit PreA